MENLDDSVPIAPELEEEGLHVGVRHVEAVIATPLQDNVQAAPLKRQPFALSGEDEAASVGAKGTSVIGRIAYQLRVGNGGGGGISC